eukprot:TRINITY_DN87637_c0_g1_i1.p1 TRINITY_DN87637_c0_g1~~TRINITY_DN87637_c0_g1_i1.p1  ORF type:complete len:520 (+),score=78.77 TRINITY_DN87637_c0_g1_i1:31-1560(+)
MFPAAHREPAAPRTKRSAPDVAVPEAPGVCGSSAGRRAVRPRTRAGPSQVPPVEQNAHRRYQDGLGREGEVEASLWLGRGASDLLSSESPCLAHPPAFVEDQRIPHSQLPGAPPHFLDGSFASRDQVKGRLSQPMTMKLSHSRGHGHHGDMQLPRKEAAPALNGNGFVQEWGFVEDGEELPLSPMPARSGAAFRATEIPCSVRPSRSANLHGTQTEHEARIAGRRGQARQHGGAPIDSAEALTPPRRSRPRSAISNLSRLEYPRIDAAGPRVPAVLPPFSLAGRPGSAAAGANSFAIDSAWRRTQLARQLSVEIGKELEHLDKAWGLGGGGSRKLEEDVAKILKAIARGVDKRFELDRLRQWLPKAPTTAAEFETQSDEVSRLQQRCADLQEELQAADEDLRQSDKECSADILDPVRELLVPRIRYMRREVESARNSGGARRSSVVHDTLEDRKQQLAASELCLQRTRQYLDDLRLDLDSRMKATVSMSLLHLPGGVPSGLLSELLRMP